MRKAFKYKLYPTRQQDEAMLTMLETHHRLYNRALEERKDAWEQEQRFWARCATHRRATIRQLKQGPTIKGEPGCRQRPVSCPDWSVNRSQREGCTTGPGSPAWWLTTVSGDVPQLTSIHIRRRDLLHTPSCILFLGSDDSLVIQYPCPGLQTTASWTARCPEYVPTPYV
jgi:hypothetical protein